MPKQLEPTRLGCAALIPGQLGKYRILEGAGDAAKLGIGDALLTVIMANATHSGLNMLPLFPEKNRDMDFCLHCLKDTIITF